MENAGPRDGGVPGTGQEGGGWERCGPTVGPDGAPRGPAAPPAHGCGDGGGRRGCGAGMGAPRVGSGARPLRPRPAPGGAAAPFPSFPLPRDTAGTRRAAVHPGHPGGERTVIRVAVIWGGGSRAMSADPGDRGWAQSRGTAQQQQQQQLALPNRSAPPPDRSTGGVSPGRVRKWLRFPQGAAASLRAPAANRGPDVILGSATPGAAPPPPPLLPLRTPGPHHSRQIWQREEPPLTALQQMAAALKGNPCPGRHTRGHSHVCVLTSAARVHTRVNRVCR